MRAEKETYINEEKSTLKIANERKPLLAFAIFAVIILVVSLFYLDFSWEKYVKIASNETIELAISLESLLHPEHIAELKGEPTEIEDPDYIIIRRSLERLVEKSSYADHAFIINKYGDEFIVLVSSIEPGSPQYALPGAVFERTDSFPFETVLLEKTAIIGTREDDFGRWISVAVPIKDSINEEVIAIFVVENPLSEWNGVLWKRMTSDFIVVFFMILLSVFFFLISLQQSTLNKLTKKLALEELLYRSVFEQAPIGIAILEDEVHLLETELGGMTINPMYEKIIGRKKEELHDITWVEMTHPDDLALDLEKAELFKKKEISEYKLEKRYLRPDGSIVWTYMSISALSGLNKDDSMHLCLLEDITLRKQAELALFESERRENVIGTYLPGITYHAKYDKSGKMLIISDGCYKLTGYPKEAFINNHVLAFNDIINPDHRLILEETWKKSIPNHLPYECEYEITTATNEKKWMLELGEGVYNNNGDPVALEGMILDITERKNSENNLKYLNEHDSWTGLHNRESLMRILEKDFTTRSKTKKALISINLSTVLLLTANYGFNYTQSLIKKAAEVLAQYRNDKRMLFKPYETRFVFYVIGYKDKEELIELSNAIGKMLEVLFITDRINGGIGILEVDPDIKGDVELLLRKLLVASERALSISEKEFKICFYDKNLADLVDREQKIREELSEIAIDNAMGKLFLHYQPLLDLKTNSICSFEALARLKTKELGMVPPLEFIPIAERTKLIIPLGEEIIKKALRFSNRLKENGFDNINVAINVSAIQMLRPDFASKFMEIIKEARGNPKNIGIEITESIFSSNYEDINKNIETFRKMGISIAIDDFGTGYSSLAREKELNVDYLKIDKYFIDKLLTTDPSKAITSDIISMAHKLGHATIAEGVEYEEQLQYLKINNCDKVQGYFISKPLGEEAALAFLKEYKKGSN